MRLYLYLVGEACSAASHPQTAAIVQRKLTIHYTFESVSYETLTTSE